MRRDLFSPLNGTNCLAGPIWLGPNVVQLSGFDCNSEKVTIFVSGHKTYFLNFQNPEMIFCSYR